GVRSGQGTSIMTLTTQAATNEGSYTVVVGGTCTPAVTSSAVTVTINSAPSITTQPSTPAATCSGTGTQTMTVAATGTGLTYDWKIGRASGMESVLISGKATSSYT